MFDVIPLVTEGFACPRTSDSPLLTRDVQHGSNRHRACPSQDEAMRLGQMCLAGSIAKSAGRDSTRPEAMAMAPWGWRAWVAGVCRLHGIHRQCNDCIEVSGSRTAGRRLALVTPNGCAPCFYPTMPYNCPVLNGQMRRRPSNARTLSGNGSQMTTNGGEGFDKPSYPSSNLPFNSPP